MAKTTLNDNSLTLDYDDEDGHLIASLKLVKSNKPFTTALLKAQIEKSGYGDLYPLDKDIDRLIDLQANQTDQIILKIAERRDGEASIECSDDDMEANLTIIPAYRGETVSLQYIQALLNKKDITFGIQLDTIKSLIAKQSANAALIVKANLAIDGADSKFESAIPAIKSNAPKINPDGTVNYRDIDVFITVKKGDVLMRRVSPTMGTAGTDIFGKVITPRVGTELHFSPVLQGAKICPDDENLLIAS